MKILITGSDGFLGREFINYFSKEHEVIPMNRAALDVSIEGQVMDFFQDTEFDAILHTAFVGVKRGKSDDFLGLTQNLIAYKNLILHKKKHQPLFCFGSGAAYDRASTIKGVEENDILSCIPCDYYGMAKNIISRDILTRTNQKVYDFRLFGCFGKEEEDSRFIKSALRNINQGNPVVINKNMVLDFFYVKDLCKVIDYYLSNHSQKLPTSMNMVYTQKYTLQNIAERLSLNNNISIGESGCGFYTGSGSTLATLQIPFLGLFEGIKDAKYNE
jgi:UDP-glucose 4-epimerase